MGWKGGVDLRTKVRVENESIRLRKFAACVTVVGNRVEHKISSTRVPTKDSTRVSLADSARVMF